MIFIQIFLFMYIIGALTDNKFPLIAILIFISLFGKNPEKITNYINESKAKTKQESPTAQTGMKDVTEEQKEFFGWE